MKAHDTKFVLRFIYSCERGQVYRQPLNPEPPTTTSPLPPLTLFITLPSPSSPHPQPQNPQYPLTSPAAHAPSPTTTA